MDPILDTKREYRTKDKTETWWVWRWEYVDGVGHKWHSYSKRPGQDKYHSKGVWDERDVVDYIKDNRVKLNEDDRIDFGVWMERGGLESLFIELKERHNGTATQGS